MRRIQAMVQGRLAAQRGDDFPGGVSQQPVVDVRPHPAAHRSGGCAGRQDLAAQLRDQLRRLHRRLGQQHSVCLERLDGRLPGAVRAGAVSGKTLGIPQPGKPRSVGIPAQSDSGRNRTHGRTCVGAQADPVRLFLLRRKLLVSLAGTAASGAAEPAPDRTVPADRNPHRHRQSGERGRAGRTHRISPVPRT